MPFSWLVVYVGRLLVVHYVKYHVGGTVRFDRVESPGAIDFGWVAGLGEL
jgi:hypothetical protein